MSHSGHPSASTATSPSLTPTAPSSSAPKRRVRAPPPKNCSCEWCGATFTKSGLGRHYDQWVYAVSPARPDEKHTEEAILRMRELRSDVRRLRGMKHMDPKEKKSLQNRRNYERHQEQQVEKKRVKRIADMARSMVFKELAKEVEEIQAHVPVLSGFATLTPTTPPGMLNLATLAYHFLPPPPTLFHPLPHSHAGTWNITHPDIHEYTALYTLFRSSPGLSEWSQRLNEEWTRWQPLGDSEKYRLATQELARAYARKHEEFEKLKAYAGLWGEGKSLQDRARKWEGRAAQLREVHGRAEEVTLTGELERIWSERGGVDGGGGGVVVGVNGGGDGGEQGGGEGEDLGGQGFVDGGDVEDGMGISMGEEDGEEEEDGDMTFE